MPYELLAITAIALLRQLRTEGRPPTEQEVASLDAQIGDLEPKVLDKLDALARQRKAGQ